MFSLPSSSSLLKVPISSFKKIGPGKMKRAIFHFSQNIPSHGNENSKSLLCWLFFFFGLFFSSDKGLALKVKVTETIFIFNFSLFSSDTDEEEMNRLAEAAVSGHSIIKNGKVILHQPLKRGSNVLCSPLVFCHLWGR